MMDGGGSTCFMDKNGEGFTGDGRVIPFFLVVKRRDPEPKGEKPMVTINAYSKAKDGEKKLSEHFKVREFACRDGSDPVLAAPRLVMILQTIRDHFGKALVINSGYRTPQYNEKADDYAPELALLRHSGRYRVSPGKLPPPRWSPMPAS